MKQVISILVSAAFCMLPAHVSGFATPPSSSRSTTMATASISSSLRSEAATAESASSDDTTNEIQTDPKEAVKLFGRLAEKYIMLDASAGLCCYSACSDCEYREPGGGYRMADQSSARPKWIPCYDHRAFDSGKEHTTKWSTEIYVDKPVVTKEEFVERVVNMVFAPPLGGPFLAAKAAGIEDESAAATLFDILAGEKDKLTKHRMGKEMKVLSNGEEGITWAMFSAAMGAK
eukprot:CAMPEP_0172302792 /NCGR_PEP_ID=MMETSP1058-20130122/4448_1 /TAXON_ID=83371 /ORGANISM="Detonula confervacea, Strain CCMP 353" /LENGTH=231 /DNA_ID=CAMNT_0013013405 /DNA_START=87 /DNA_END=782 /DNA_ORIENTATION=+